MLSLEMAHTFLADWTILSEWNSEGLLYPTKKFWTNYPKSYWCIRSHSLSTFEFLISVCEFWIWWNDEIPVRSKCVQFKVYLQWIFEKVKFIMNEFRKHCFYTAIKFMAFSKAIMMPTFMRTVCNNIVTIKINKQYICIQVKI